jgi:hypothetical protein
MMASRRTRRFPKEVALAVGGFRDAHEKLFYFLILNTIVFLFLLSFL